MARKFTVQEGSPATIRYYVVNPDETPIVPADVEEVVYHVFELEAGTRKTPNDGVEVEDAVEEELQTWNEDSTGWNLSVTVSGSYLTDGNKNYRLEVRVTPTDGDPYYLEHVELKTTETMSA